MTSFVKLENGHQQDQQPGFPSPEAHTESISTYRAQSFDTSVPDPVAALTGIHDLAGHAPFAAEGHTFVLPDVVDMLRQKLRLTHIHHGEHTTPESPIEYEAALGAVTDSLRNQFDSWFDADPSTPRSFASQFDYVPVYEALVSSDPLGWLASSEQIHFRHETHSALIAAVVSVFLVYLRDVNGFRI